VKLKLHETVGNVTRDNGGEAVMGAIKFLDAGKRSVPNLFSACYLLQFLTLSPISGTTPFSPSPFWPFLLLLLETSTP
jgi:hypothetical protein